MSVVVATLALIAYLCVTVLRMPNNMLVSCSMGTPIFQSVSFDLERIGNIHPSSGPSMMILIVPGGSVPVKVSNMAPRRTMAKRVEILRNAGFENIYIIRHKLAASISDRAAHLSESYARLKEMFPSSGPILVLAISLGAHVVSQWLLESPPLQVKPLILLLNPPISFRDTLERIVAPAFLAKRVALCDT